jgi:uncharacterized protein (TIGR03000 family)
MKYSSWYKVCSFGFCLAILGIFANQSLGQCACGNSLSQSEGIVYGAISAGDVLGPESQLEEFDDPTKIINLTVVVHDKAIVKINGEPTVTTGTVRPYIVRGLTPGKSYEFKIEGLVRQPKGDVYFATKTIKLSAGKSEQVVLNVRRANREDHKPEAAAAAK